MEDIKSLQLDELTQKLKDMGQSAFRGKQIYTWLHKRGVKSFDDMTDISKDLRQKLQESFYINTIEEVTHQESSIDGTRKYLFKLRDDSYVESVLMKYHHGNSICISSQVGCRMGCKFCASTIEGLYRSLSASEMLDQVYEVSRLSGERVSNIVIMGIGEPMDNFDNVVSFLRIISSEDGFNLSQRNITVSTCGIVERIKELADLNLQITLAISLHGSNQKVRESIMPVAKMYSLDQVMDACKYYFEKTHRRISFEYALISGVNDKEENIRELTELLSGHNCHLNLIPVNPIKERDFAPSSKEWVYKFQNKLEKNGINVTIRREMGRDIDGACGQLRRRKMLREEL